MSFWKAEQIIGLATLAAARHGGITIDEVTERFGQDIERQPTSRAGYELWAGVPEVRSKLGPDLIKELAHPLQL